MTYEEISKELKKNPNVKTKDLDCYNKKCIKNKIDVSDLKTHVISDSLVHRTYFQVSLGLLNGADSVKNQFKFIEENAELLQDWWHVDQLTQFLTKPIDFDFAFQKSQEYIKSPNTFLRRWGYVLFLTGLQKDKNHTNKILSLMKDDDEYYVQMAEAWLIADLAVFNFPAIKKFMENTKLKYNIAGKAIQKMCDSFRISAEDKEFMKTLRCKLKEN